MAEAKSLFMQIGSMSNNDIKKYCEAVRSSDTRIYNLVVTLIGSTDGTLYADKLLTLRPYLPGGDKQTFDNVFFGTSHDYNGYSKPYEDDMFNSEFRWKNLRLQRKLAEALSGLLTDVTFHWYIEHEAPLNKLSNADLRAMYEAYLIQSVNDLRSIRAGTAVLWSPAIWEYRPTAETATQLGILFKNIKDYTDGIGVNWLHLQDTAGRHWFNPTAYDIRAWFDALPNTFDSKRINVEQFREEPDGSIFPANRAEVEAREKSYLTLGMPIGACWEIRWWWGVQQQPVQQDLASLYSGCLGCGKASNTKLANRAEVREWLKTGRATDVYARRAAVVADASARLRDRFPLEVQGAYYMRPYLASVIPGRAVNSDHLTAGALDIFFRTDEDKTHHPAVKAILDEWKRRGVVRYYLDLGYNWAHRDHIHVSFQIGVRL